jgi:cellulose synthase/poly-beta-1,6-N-acetylglucosamine synthase-like glycosyltransferase
MPMWNEEKHLEWTLKSVFNLDYPKNKLKVICVNDGSTDNTLSLLKKLNKIYDFKIIDKKNGGKHTALNEALKTVETPFFACLDVDCYVESGALKSLLVEFDSPNVAAVMPILKVNNPRNILQRVQWLEYMINIFYKYAMGKLDCVHVTPGPLSIYRTKIIKKLGCFKKAHMTEDLEMALRLQNNNYKLKQSLSAIVYTETPKTLGNFISQRTRWYQGTLLNIKDYKHLLFNKKYGDFGSFHMPLVAVTGILTLIGVLVAIYLLIKNLYLTIKRAYLTHFDFITYINSFRWNFSLIDLDWQVLFMTSILFFLVFVVIYFAMTSSRERLSVLLHIKFFFMFLYYFLLWSFLMGLVWAKVVFKIVTNRGNSWNKVN